MLTLHQVGDYHKDNDTNTTSNGLLYSSRPVIVYGVSYQSTVVLSNASLYENTIQDQFWREKILVNFTQFAKIFLSN